MKKIVTLTGHKFTKKHIIAENLAKNSDVEFVKQYTDAKEELNPHGHSVGWGFHHVSKEELDYMIEHEEVIQQTIVNGHRYCLFKSQLTAPYNVVIVDDYGVVDIRDKWKGKLYSIRLVSDNEVESDRVGEYLYKHEFDLVYDVDNDDFNEMEARIV